jgi:4-hydroxy-tetrahydrodipicolinate reductase
MIKAAVAGAAGRMGKAIIKAINEIDGIELSGALEHKDHQAIGQDAGNIAGIREVGIGIVSDVVAVLDSSDVLIDFTSPRATLFNLEGCADNGVSSVIGTTGLSEEDLEALTIFASRTPTVFSPNMSVGVNLLFRLAEIAASSLGDSYDLEIFEAHHRMKKDAPSGTAMRLAEIVAQALGRDLDKSAVYERRGMIGERTKKEIGIQTLRAGDIVGEHTLLLAGPGERLELTHRAHSRDNFAQGAVRAALWLKDKEPGLYSMADVLGLG